MLRFVVRRLLQLVPTLLGLSVLLFAWLRALPGVPISRSPPALVVAENVTGLEPSPLTAEVFSTVSITE